MPDLDTRLLAAHANNDKAALVTLYTQAADQSDTLASEMFFLTHAYVFALETAHTDAAILKNRLVAANRL